LRFLVYENQVNFESILAFLTLLCYHHVSLGILDPQLERILRINTDFSNTVWAHMLHSEAPASVLCCSPHSQATVTALASTQHWWRPQYVCHKPHSPQSLAKCPVHTTFCVSGACPRHPPHAQHLQCLEAY
jgi:hypothetical protein